MNLVKLVPFEEQHLPTVLEWVNTPSVRDNIGTIRPVSMVEHREWYRAVQTDKSRLQLIISDSKRNAPIGMVGLASIDQSYRNAELWLYLGEASSRRKGFGRAAVAEMLKMAFGSLGLHRVYAHVFEFNEPAKRLFSSCGFTFEGTLRDAAFKGGRFVNKDLFSILATEWQGKTS